MKATCNVAGAWALMVGTCLGLNSTVSAQDYPSRPLKLFVPFAAGGGSDVVSRLVMEPLAAKLGQPIVVENRPGVGGNLGMSAGATAAPDGYTLTTLTQNLASNPHMYATMPFEPLKAFQPVSIMVKVYSMLIANPKVPATSLAELIAYAKANPGKLNTGHGGVGGQTHLSLLLVGSAAGLKMAYVPYRGESLVLTDVLSGQLDLTVQSFVGIDQHIAAGALRPLGVTSPKPLAQFPNVPAITETLPGFEVSGWYGIALPAGTSPAIVQRLSSDLRAVLNDPAMRKGLGDRGFEVIADTPEEFKAVIEADYEKYRRIITEAGIKPQ